MRRSNYHELQAFLTVARVGSFTRAAAQFGVAQSAFSHTIRRLESRLGVRLLTRTTRSVSLTEAGERLYKAIATHFEDIDAEVAALTELQGKPTGTVRITASVFAYESALWPKLAPVLASFPGIKVEFDISGELRDIVANRFDAGVRIGEQVQKDMVAVPIGPPLRMAVVGSSAYFAQRALPKKPDELAAHNCINLRLPTRGGLYVWEFERKGRPVNVRVDGQLTYNDTPRILDAALNGFGLAYLPEGAVKAHVAAGRLLHVLGDWCPPFPGYHLYYPSRRQHSPAFAIVLDALRERGPQADARGRQSSM